MFASQSPLGRAVAAVVFSATLVHAASCCFAQPPKKAKPDLDAKALQAEVDELTRIKFTRTPDEVFAAVAKSAEKLDENLPRGERLVFYVHAGDWDALHDFLSEYPDEHAQRLHLKIVGDLMFPRGLMLPGDVLRLADASTTELDDRQASSLGKLLSFALLKGESRGQLMALLRTGTKRLGGTDPARRRTTARMLAAAELWNEAKEFGLRESEIPDVAKAEAAVPAQLADEAWGRVVAVLHDAGRPAEERERAFADLYRIFLEATPQEAQSRLAAVVRDAAHPDLKWDVAALLGRKAAASLQEGDFAVRRIHLELQSRLLKLLAESGKLDQPPLRTLAGLYARNWLNEAQTTTGNPPGGRKVLPGKGPHVPLETMLQTGPTEAVVDVLDPQLAGYVKLARARLFLMSDDVQRVIPLLSEFVARDPQAAGELANDYLVRWAQLHDPNFSPEAMKQYRLEGHAIVLTRSEQAESLRQLGEMLGKLDAPTRELLDEAMLVQAFDLCHSRAEIYTRDQIAQVFGPIEKLRPSLVLLLVDRMRLKLGVNWRQLSLQHDAATKRDAAELFQLVNDGYRQADAITTEWLRGHADDWRMNCLTGSLLSDWAEFAYFQAVVDEADVDRFAVYLKHTAAAAARFRDGARAYAARVPTMKRTEYDLLPYRSWFYGLLGISGDGGINLRKGVTAEGLQEIRRAMLDLPGGAADEHLELFATMVGDNVKANVIAPEMKYRYLSSAVEIVGRRPTVYPAEEKVQYYDSLLKEIRLRARLDGSEKIRTDGHFGVFVTLVHTADLARQSGGFGKYLQNDIRRTVNGKQVTEQPRDRFEEALRLALADVFEIKAIVFADPNAGARDVIAGDDVPAGGDGEKSTSGAQRWQETPLAYLLLVANDATVDRVPPLEIELDFFDRDGKVVIPVPSPPILIDVAADAPARRAVANLAVTEIVDARELADERLKLDVVATARGLVPELDEVLELSGYSPPVEQVDAREGLLIREFKSDDDGLYVLSERNWTVHLDPAPLLRGASQRIDFQFPPAKADVAATFRRYQDMDPVDAASSLTLVEGGAVEELAKPNYKLWALSGLAGLLVVGLIATAVLRRKSDGAVARSPRFVLPREVTPFSTLHLLHRIQTEPQANLSAADRAQLQGEIASLERAAFAGQPTAASSRDLESLAQRWLKLVSHITVPNSTGS